MSTVIRRMAPAGLALGMMLLSGCATEHGQVETAAAPMAAPLVPPPPAAAGPLVPGMGTIIPPGVSTPPVMPNYPKTIRDTGANPAVLSLYRQAQEAYAGGRYDQADELLQRSVDKDPHNPFIWQQLAMVRLSLKQPEQAEQAAEKSNTLARGNPYVEAGNWRLIAKARQALGNVQGATQAEARADDIARSLSGTP
ncbi:MAG: tetratricopeptide repeat protein [Nevskia sp.]|nr:tetratricopeptide repeat protein [Nevskia sp.]